MDDDVNALHGAVHCCPVADVAFDLADLAAFGVIKIGNIERGDFMAAFEQIAGQVDAQESGPAGNQIVL